MPTFTPRLFLFLCLTLFRFLTPPPLLASTDPLSATVSATARVPSTSPTTADTTAPGAVILISPGDNTTTGSNRPELVWKQTSDPNSNTLYYTVYLNGVATYLGVSNTGNSQMHNYVARLSDNQVHLTPTSDLPDGRYTWYVTASDLSSNTSYSATWHFTVDTTAPPLTLTNIDETYPYPDLSITTNFELPGPQAVSLTFLTESWATVSLTYRLPDGTTASLQLPTQSSGIASFTLDLPLGITEFVATSSDQVAHTTTLPAFTLTLVSTPFAGLTLTPPLKLPRELAFQLVPLQSLPVSITQITTLPYLTFLIYLLLALILLLLLILLWKRRPNLVILHAGTNEPYRSLIVYHSRPLYSARFASTPKRVYVTTRSPVLYSLPSGRVYIPRLGHYSTLTIRTPGGATHILSLSRQLQRYVVNL